MTSKPLPPQSYELAAKYDLGEPIRVYHTRKRALFVWLGLALTFTCIFFAVSFAVISFPSNHELIPSCMVVIILMLLVGLPFCVPLLLIRRTNVYVCSAGFILHRKASYRIVRWKEVEWVVSVRRSPIVYLINQEQVKLNRSIGNVKTLAQEIELKGRLVRRSGSGRLDSLEVQFERLLSTQAIIAARKSSYLQRQKRPEKQEPPDEAFSLQRAYRLGDFGVTHHGGFKGILRKETVTQSLNYLLSLIFACLTLEGIFHFIPYGSDLVSGMMEGLTSNLGVVVVLYLYTYPFRDRFAARFLRLHLYTGGFVYIDGGTFEVVSWGQIEKVIYHKTGALVSPPFCHIYLTNGDTITISGYIYDQDEIRRVFNFYVANTVQAG